MTVSVDTSHQQSVDERYRLALRRLMRLRRNRLTPQQQRQAGLAISQRLLAHPKIRNADHIALYSAFDGEVNTQPLCQQLWQQGKQLYLPRLNRQQPGQLLFTLYQPHHKLQRNSYGILEPLSALSELVSLQQLTLLLVPVVAFDANCRRLGMGGGYYDRTLNDYFLKYPSLTPPFLMGLAHYCQQVASLPTAPWDWPLQAVMTPQQLFLK
ncbi:MAG: 5-formyltetrahydrofolate cyclo-ligase [Candidatus Symbiodolus clandestinus]